MINLCSIIRCPNRKQKHVPLIRLPTSSLSLSKWMEFIVSENGDFQEKKTYRICHGHFKQDDIYHNGHSYRLKQNAFPKISSKDVVQLNFYDFYYFTELIFE